MQMHEAFTDTYRGESLSAKSVLKDLELILVCMTTWNVTKALLVRFASRNSNPEVV